MPGYGASFSRGVLLGLGAALLYAAARETSSPARRAPVREALAPEQPRLVDWTWAERVAVRASGQAPTMHPAARTVLEHDYATLLAELEEPISAYTGNHLPLGHIVVEPMDRPAWIRANLRNFRDLLQPVEAFYQESAGAARFEPSLSIPAMQQATRLTLSAQLGILVGYLSRRVLGQYDLGLLAAEPFERGRLYFVEPNLRHVRQALDVPLEDLRRWVALHEATHAHEFEVYPWVREHLNTTLRSYLRLLIDDMRRQVGSQGMMGLSSRLLSNLRSGHNLIAAMQTPEQRELMNRLQALMSLAEGYSNHVMNTVGRQLLPNFDVMHERVEHRQRQRSQIEHLFLRITGLSLKMEQYRRGEQFVNEVVRLRGIAFANRAWEAPENLPSEAEIREPERWVARLEGSSAA